MKKVEIGFSKPLSVFGKLIKPFMSLYSKNRYGYSGSEIFTHVFLKITDGKECYVCEALETWKRTDWNKTEYAKYGNYKLKEPVQPFTQIELLTIISKSNEWIGKKYDSLSIGAQIWRTLSGGRWIGLTGKQAEKLVICSEGVATIVNYARSWMFAFACGLNPMDMWFSKNIKLSE